MPFLGCVVGCRNRAAEQFYQWNAEEVLGLNVLEFLVPSNLKKTAKDILVRVGKGESWTGQYPSLRRDGCILNTVVAQKPLVDDEQGIIGISFSSESYNSMPQVVGRSYSEGLGRVIEDNNVLDGTHSGQKLLLEPPPPDGEATGRNLLVRHLPWQRQVKKENLSVTLVSLELFLNSLKSHVLVGSFAPLLISCEHPSGVGTPNCGEMKERQLNVAKRRLYKNEFHDKLLKAPKMMLSKV